MLHKITIMTGGVPAIGFIDSSGAIVIEPRFYQVLDYREDRAGVHVRAASWGIIDEKGALIVEPRYEKVGVFSEGLCAVLDAEGWGFVDRTGRQAIANRIRQQWPLFAFPYFRDGLCAIPSDDGALWGYCDREGKVVIPQQFAFATPFSEGFAVVEDAKGRASYIDRTGKPAFVGRWQKAWPFDGGIAAVEEKGHWGVINTSGAYVRAPEFKHHEQYSPRFPTTDPLLVGRGPLELHDDRSLFRTDKKKWGYLSSSGELAIAASYDKGGFFSEGLAPVLKRVKGQSRWGVIDPNGVVVVDHTIEQMATYCVFRDGLVPVGVKVGYAIKWGFIDRKGSLVVPHEHDGAQSFRDGLAHVYTGEVASYINTRGETVWRTP